MPVGRRPTEVEKQIHAPRLEAIFTAVAAVSRRPPSGRRGGSWQSSLALPGLEVAEMPHQALRQAYGLGATACTVLHDARRSAEAAEADAKGWAPRPNAMPLGTRPLASGRLTRESSQRRWR